MTERLEKTLVIWWRFGKEHEGEGIRVNPPYVITEHLDRKAAAFRTVQEKEWRWWQADDTVIVERADASDPRYGDDTRIYYLPARDLTVIENPHDPRFRSDWKWHIYLADVFYDTSRDCWIKKDLFCEILVDDAGRHTRVRDLRDLAEALCEDFIDTVQAGDILCTLESVLDEIDAGDFPFDEIVRGQALCRQLGWDSNEEHE